MPDSDERAAELYDALSEKFAFYRRDPVAFARDFLGITTLWGRQIEVLEAVRDHTRVAVPSGHDVGKSFVASVVIWWWKVCFRPSKVIITAPSGRQADEILGREIRSRHADMARRFSPAELKVLLGTDKAPGMTQWEANEQNFILWFSTTSDTASENASKFQGYHSPHLLVVFDEAGGVQRPIWEAADGNLADEGAHFLAIGQPSDPSSPFAREVGNAGTKTVRIDVLDFPNVVTGERRFPYGPHRGWVDYMRRKYGEESGIWQYRVRGLFPTVAQDTLIGYAMANTALERLPPADCVHPPGQLGMGCDVARFGDDRTVIIVICTCGAFVTIAIRQKQDGMATVGLILAAAKEVDFGKIHSPQIAVDDTGGIGGVTERLRELGWRVRAVNFGAKPVKETSEEKFTNRRAELWWRMKEWLKEVAALADMPDELSDELRDELTTPKYKYSSDQRIQLEPKDAIKKRIGRSPDYGDALALAVAALPRPGRAWQQEAASEGAVRRDPYWDRDNAPKEDISGYAVGNKNVHRELADW